MMLRFFGRCGVRQYMAAKPDRFGLKCWALCTASGFLSDLDIYCGKNATNKLLPSCALGSRVVIQMVSNLLLKEPQKKKI